MDSGWTIDELAQRTADALAAAGVHAPNGRVSQVPDRRLIRWYATIGLIDRPLRGAGRGVRYGERHLLQLVAVKRRQAQGRTLTEIQAELAGATDATLRRVAGPSVASAPAVTPPAEAQAPRRRFWAGAPAAPDPDPPSPDAAGAGLPGRGAAEPIYPLPLHPAATLVLAAPPRPEDLAAIHAAARPLLELLAARGLLTRPRRPA